VDDYDEKTYEHPTGQAAPKFEQKLVLGRDSRTKKSVVRSKSDGQKFRVGRGLRRAQSSRSVRAGVDAPSSAQAESLALP